MFPNRLISIAPMMGCTDRHYRYFLRLLTKNAVLYTEMVTVNALLYGDAPSFLQFHPSEYPIALQLGGNDPGKLATCAKMAEERGYNEVNLNVGCPSDRVKSGQFGACLMLNPLLVRECVGAMVAAVKIPITVKCRIGVDNEDSIEALMNFITQVSSAGCQIFIIHARKAWLQGLRLSPKQNREIPPLRYDVVYEIKKAFPHLTIIVNGGIKKLSDVAQHIQHTDGVMIGREAYTNPFFLTELEKHFFPAKELPLSRHQVIENYLPYIKEQLHNNLKLSLMTRHLFGLFQGEKGARNWRRYLSEHAYKKDAGINILHEALALVNLHQ